MTRPTLPPVPFAVPPAPVAMTRAASSYVHVDAVPWFAERGSVYRRKDTDTAADVFELIGGAV